MNERRKEVSKDGPLRFGCLVSSSSLDLIHSSVRRTVSVV